MKIAIITLGCKTNEYESHEIGQKLAQLGHEVGFEIEPADFYVLNTCSITANADAKSRQLIARVLAKNKNAKIVVCGCSSQYDKTAFEKHPNVTAVFGTHDKSSVTQFFAQQADSKPYTLVLGKARRLVKIGDGCNNFCTYCIVPHLRGRATSRTINEIVAEITAAKEQEVVLTAINLNNFRPGLASLFNALANATDKRIRLGSIEPQMITKEFLAAFAALKKPCPHFHLSVQSGCNTTLQAMNRHYDSTQIISACNLIRSFFSDAFIACDVIVGFPEESDADFAQSLSLLHKCSFAHMHIFPFSLRQGTLAQKLKQVPPKIIKERVKQMTIISKQSAKDFLAAQTGKTAEVLIEQKKGDYLTGHTRNFIKCYVKNAPAFIKSGSMVSVKLEEPIFDGMLAILNN